MKSSIVKYNEAIERRLKSGINVLPGDTLESAKFRAGVRKTDARFDEAIKSEVAKFVASQEKQTASMAKAKKAAKKEDAPAPIAPVVVAEEPLPEEDHHHKKHRPRGNKKRANV